MNKVAPEPEPEDTVVAAKSTVIHDKPARISAGVASIFSQQSTGSSRSANIVDSETREQQELIKVSDERKEYIALVRPEHDKNISGWTTRGFFVFGSTEQDLGDSKYQIFSPGGEILFYAVETLQAFESYPSRVKEIEITTTGARGGVVFQISGSNKYCAVKDGDEELLGTITREGIGSILKPSYKHWSYAIRDAEGVVVCRIERPPNKDRYDIYVTGSKESVGEIKDSWPENTYQCPESGTGTGNILGLMINSNYVKHFDPGQKTLILAAAMVTYNNQNGPEDNYGQNKRRFKFGLIYNTGMAGIILILALVVILVTLDSASKPPRPPICD